MAKCDLHVQKYATILNGNGDIYFIRQNILFMFYVKYAPYFKADIFILYLISMLFSLGTRKPKVLSKIEHLYTLKI